jgi:hypothetical protein
MSAIWLLYARKPTLIGGSYAAALAIKRRKGVTVLVQLSD